MSQGSTTTDKSRDMGPYLHIYVVTVILPTKTFVEVSLASSAIFDPVLPSEWVILHALLLSAEGFFFQNHFFSKISFRITISVSLDQDQAQNFVGPGLSAQDTNRQGA